MRMTIIHLVLILICVQYLAVEGPPWWTIGVPIPDTDGIAMCVPSAIVFILACVCFIGQAMKDSMLCEDDDEDDE